MPVRDAAFCEIVRGHFERDSIACQYANSISAKLAGEVRQHGPLLVKLNAEKAAREFFNYCSCDFNAVFFTHCPLFIGISLLP